MSFAAPEIDLEKICEATKPLLNLADVRARSSILTSRDNLLKPKVVTSVNEARYSRHAVDMSDTRFCHEILKAMEVKVK